MAEGDRIRESLRLGGLTRMGSPTLLQPVEGQLPLYDSVNLDFSSEGRARPRPVARALYAGGADASLWPRLLTSST